MSLLRDEDDQHYFNYSSTFGTFSAPRRHHALGVNPGIEVPAALPEIQPASSEGPALLLITGGGALQFADTWRFRGSDTDFIIQQLVGGTWTDRVIGKNTPLPFASTPATTEEAATKEAATEEAATEEAVVVKWPHSGDGEYLDDKNAHNALQITVEEREEAIAQANDAFLFAQTLAAAAEKRELNGVNQANASSAFHTLTASQAAADHAEWQTAFDIYTKASALAAAPDATELQVLEASAARAAEVRAADTRDISEAAAKCALIQRSLDAAARDIYTAAAQRSAFHATEAAAALHNL